MGPDNYRKIADNFSKKKGIPLTVLSGPVPGRTTWGSVKTSPYEVWYKKKPDIGHLRVWGCVAYVHVQRDKCSSLNLHIDKCIFIGYPQGYKGWKFYNPATKKVIISERADFDEC